MNIKKLLINLGLFPFILGIILISSPLYLLKEIMDAYEKIWEDI
jgi:hypothetical protein